ncbi:MAG: aminopeptidase P N-terminal domain-containing protein [Candidatus Protistobacter heckmanni]|nr:aminopeptidase P N-terminal domain-containing protein [Candidatus Protistobacter heckmanni]
MRARMPEGIAILGTAPEVARNGDSEFPYRHDSYFYYLTGFAEPMSTLVLIAGDTPAGDKALLFCREKNLEREIWDGYRYGPEAAREAFGFDEAYGVSELDARLPALLAGRKAVFSPLGQSEAADAQLRRWLDALRMKSRAGVTVPSSQHDLTALIDEMRLVKDAGEIATMRRAAQISAEAHKRAMRICKPGLREYHLEAELLHAFRQAGSQSVAYNSIVAAGPNACVLHYRAGDAELRAGDLCLIDAGCELDSYASDITRTFPVSGKFSPAPRELYDIVLASQEAAVAATAPGRHFMEPHEAALKVLAQGMLDTGLLDRNQVGGLEDVIANQSYAQFYMHRTGHWLGMDVHDCGDYREPAADASGERPWRVLRPGMVTTVEPGIYVRPGEGVPERYWHIGIRIEDDAVVTPQGCELISRDVPVKADEIEALMRG